MAFKSQKNSEEFFGRGVLYMNINDYRKAMEKIEINPEYKERIIESSMKKNDRKHGFSKKRMIPILAAAVVGCVAVTAVVADDFAGIFRKQTNFEINISSIAEPQENEVHIMNAVPKKWDEDVVFNLFANGKTPIESNEYVSDTNPDVMWKYIQYDDSVLSFEDGDISWRDDSDYNSYSYSYVRSVIFNGKDSGENLFPEANLDGFDKDDAIQEVDEILNTLDISVNSPEVYALDADNLNLVDDFRNENGERVDKHDEVLPDWTKEQEAYLIFYQVDGGNVNISQKASWFDGCGTDGSIVYAIVSRNGLEEFSARWVYDITESEEAPIEVCTAEEAADAVYAQFSARIADYPTLVENCHLVYLPVSIEWGKKYELRPYWEFYSTEKIHWYTEESEKVNMDYYDTLFVDAETCEILSGN